jgi:hypothetical protein
MHRLNVVRVAGLTALGVLVVACKPSAPLALTGRVSLMFESLRNDGMSVSDVFFILENRTRHAIYFQGTQAFWSRTATPAYTTLSCADPDPSITANESTFRLPDYSDGPPAFIKVSPGDRVRLDVASYGDEVARHRGGTCLLRLKVRGGDYIESAPFHPIVTF